MGRTRSFDPGTVIDQATACFVETGYEGTSIDRLVGATGVHRGSLYGTFGSKRGLFLCCLDRAMPPEARTPLPDRAVDLLLVAILELAPRDRQVRQRCADALVAVPAGEDAARWLGARLLARSGLTIHR